MHSDASLDESGSKLSKVAATSLLMGVTRGSSDAYGEGAILVLCVSRFGYLLEEAVRAGFCGVLEVVGNIREEVEARALLY